MFAIEGNIVGLLVSFAAIVIGGGLLTYIIWHIKADFYEDAMAKSEETAELLAAAQSQKGGVAIVKRKKDRSDNLRRDGMQRGSVQTYFSIKPCTTVSVLPTLVFLQRPRKHIWSQQLVLLFCAALLSRQMA